MKTIYLLRHAKSSWDDPALPDYHRPLAPRGRKASPKMGRFMKKEGLLPHRVLCSGALRATQTWELVASILDRQVPTEIHEEIYHGAPGNLLRMIRALPGEEASALLVGHNPTMEDLALLLAGSGEEAALQEMRRKFPTAALAVLDFHGADWPEVLPGSCHLRAFVRPKALKGRI